MTFFIMFADQYIEVFYASILEYVKQQIMYAY